MTTTRLAPHPRSVDVWVVELASVTPAMVSSLSSDERARAGRMRVPGARERFVAARAALRTILARCTGEPSERLRFDVRCRWCGDAEHGKPALAGAGSIRFSASRAGSLALVAVATARDVGVDVELAGTDWSAASAVAFAPAERAAARDGRCSAASLWCRKEAATKAVGRGLALDPRACRADAPPDEHGWRQVRPAPGAPPLAVCDIAVPGPYAAALAVAASEPPDRVRLRSLTEATA